jgi:hypothetical protein
MPHVAKKPDGAGRAWLVKRLIKETGITEAEASDLVMLLGTDWPSLVREAHLLKKKRYRR